MKDEDEYSKLVSEMSQERLARKITDLREWVFSESVEATGEWRAFCENLYEQFEFDWATSEGEG